MKLANSSGKLNKRRKNALIRLENQLTSKVRFVNFKTGEVIPLSEANIIRINKEIANIKAKIVSDESARADKPKKYRAVR